VLVFSFNTTSCNIIDYILLSGHTNNRFIGFVPRTKVLHFLCRKLWCTASSQLVMCDIQYISKYRDKKFYIVI